MLKDSSKNNIVNYALAGFAARLQPVTELTFCKSVCGAVRQEPQ